MTMAMTMAPWQAQAMWERETARIWEKMQQEDEEIAVSRYDTRCELEEATRKLTEIYDTLATAADKAQGLPEEHRVLSVLSAIDELEAEVKGICADLRCGR